MSDVKERLYNYETTPPAGVWEAIASQLDVPEAKVIPLQPRSKKRFYYMAAASVAVILLCVVLFTQRSSNNNKQWFSWSSSENEQKDNSIAQTNNDTTAVAKNDSAYRITVPEETKDEAINNQDEDELIANNTPAKGGPSEKINKKDTKKNENADEKIIASRYITIEGPQGEPVKVSSKLATLIDSSDNKVPPKPTWNKKINEWREIMKTNTLAPTPGNFLDIIELSKTLKDNKKP